VIGPPRSWYIPPKRWVRAVKTNRVGINAVYVHRVDEVLEHARIIDRRWDNLVGDEEDEYAQMIEVDHKN
jgi:hypothetical protein